MKRLKHRKKNQDAGLKLKELYKVIRTQSDYLKLSKKGSEKVETYKQKEEFFEDPWKIGKQVLDGIYSHTRWYIQPSGEHKFQGDLRGCFQE